MHFSDSCEEKNSLLTGRNLQQIQAQCYHLPLQREMGGWGGGAEGEEHGRDERERGSYNI